MSDQERTRRGRANSTWGSSSAQSQAVVPREMQAQVMPDPGDYLAGEPGALYFHVKFPKNMYKHFVGQKGDARKPNGAPAGRSPDMSICFFHDRHLAVSVGCCTLCFLRSRGTRFFLPS